MDNIPPSVDNPRAPHGDPAPCLIRLADLLGDWDADAEARFRARQEKRPLGPVTGLKGLDAALGQALAPGLHILHGVPGVGKTAFALQTAAGCGCPCLYVSCEMTALELLRRITARTTGTYLGKFKTGELPPEYSGRLAREAITATPLLALLDATQTPISPAELLPFAEGTRNLDRDSPHLLLVVDSLHSWAEGYAPAVPEYESLNAGLAALRRIASQLNCPVLAVAERNRVSMDKGGLSAGAGSRKIEYGAESVLDLDCEKDARDDANGEKPVTLRIAKNRNGPAGRPVALKFHGALQRYTEG